MAIAFVEDQAVSGGGSVSSWTITPTGWAPAIGQIIRIDLHGPSAANAISSLSYTGVGSWATTLTNDTNRKGRSFTGVITSAPSGDITVNQSTTNAGVWSGTLSVFTGLPLTNAGAVSAQSSVATGSGTSVSTATVTPPAGRDALIMCMLRGSGTAPAVPGGYTALLAPDASTLLCYKLVSAASGTEVCAGTWGSSGSWIAHMMVFSLGVLTITQQPTAASSGVAFSPVVTVEARTNGTSVDTGITASCTAAVASGGGSLSGTNPRGAAAGVATFTGLAVIGSGAHTLTFSMLGFMPVTSSSFTMSGPSTTAGVVSSPDLTVLSGETFTVVGEVLVGGVRDTASVLTGTLSKLSGANATLSAVAGSLSNVAAAAGLISFSVKLDGRDDTVLRLTLSSGQTVDVPVLYVRPVAYSRTNEWVGPAPIRGADNTVHWYKYWIQSGASAATPLPVMAFGNDVNHYAEDAPSQKDGAQYLIDGQTFFDRVSGAFGYMCFAMPCAFNNDGVKLEYFDLWPSLFARMASDGFVQNERRRWWGGYSTAATWVVDMLKRHPTTWCGSFPIDGAYGSPTGTDIGAGPPVGAYPGYLYEPTPQTNDAAFYTQWCTDLHNSGHAIAFVHGNKSDTIAGWGININDAITFINRMEALYPGSTGNGNGVAATTMTLDPSKRFVRWKFTDADHGAMESLAVSVANFAVLKAFMDAHELPEPAGSLIFARLSDGVFVGANLLAQRDPAPRLSSPRETRPGIRFIR